MKLTTYKLRDGSTITGCQCVEFNNDTIDATIIKTEFNETCPNCGEWDLNEEKMVN